MRHALVVPASQLPRKDPVNPCPCQERPVDLSAKKGVLFWLRQEGEAVEAGEVLCEGEVDKQVLEFTAPCSGVLCQQCVADEEVFSAGDVLGYLEDTP